MVEFVIVVPAYNVQDDIDGCLGSIRVQDYQHYRVVVINDASTDQTGSIIQKYAGPKLQVITRSERQGSSVSSHVSALWSPLGHPNEVVVDLDGDDRLIHGGVLSYLATLYANPDVWLTYGSFVHRSNSEPCWCQPVNDTRGYRKHEPWKTSHLRTYRRWLWQRIKDEDLRDPQGRYFQFAGDMAMMFPMVEMAGNKHIHCVGNKILYFYNDCSPLNEHHVDASAQFLIGQYIRSKPCYDPILTAPEPAGTAVNP